MQDMINQLITTGLGLGILGAAYLVDLGMGSVKVLFTKGMKWQWKKWGEDFIKAIILALGIEAWVAIWFALNWYCTKCGADIKVVADGFSTAGLIAGIIGGTAYYLKNAYGNAVEFINTKHIQIEVGEIKYGEIAEKIYELFPTPKEAVDAHKEFEEEKAKEEAPLDGGQGVYYSVPYNTYDAFRGAVLGKGFDLDNCYGYQCWDGACLLWQQIGRWLETGNGAAEGCWRLKKDVNAGGDFELIYNKADIKRGDIVVFSCGQFGHIGFADENYGGGAYIRFLGQNQGGTPVGAAGGSGFNVINMSMATFMGAFRFKQWKETPAPAPTPKPADDGKVWFTYKSGDTFGQKILDLGLGTEHGLWGADGDVAYYTEQLHEQGIYGNLPLGVNIWLKPRN